MAAHAQVHAMKLIMSKGERVGRIIPKVMAIPNKHGDLQLEY